MTCEETVNRVSSELWAKLMEDATRAVVIPEDTEELASVLAELLAVAELSAYAEQNPEVLQVLLDVLCVMQTYTPKTQQRITELLRQMDALTSI